MATKEQERKALQKIKNIIEEVGGADSYIGMTFEGAFDIAIDNIDNDWGNSCQFFIDEYRKGLNKIDRKELDEAIKEKEELQKEIEKQKLFAQDQSTLRQEAEEDARELCKRIEKAHKDYDELKDQYIAQKRLVHEKEDEIIRLKAKLYDLMTA